MVGRSSPIDAGAVDALASMSLDEQRRLWRQLFRKPPVPGLSGELLVRVLAQRLQVLQHGGTSSTLRQRLRVAAAEASAALAGPEVKAQASGGAELSSSRVLRPGTRLVRDWNGATYEIVVTGEGYRWNDRTFRSLSTIARTITGTNWNGWRFFGVGTRAKGNVDPGGKDRVDTIRTERIEPPSQTDPELVVISRGASCETGLGDDAPDLSSPRSLRSPGSAPRRSTLAEEVTR